MFTGRLSRLASLRHASRQMLSLPPPAASRRLLSTSFRDRMRTWRQNGTLEIALGSFMLSVLLLDRFFLYLRDQENAVFLETVSERVKEDARVHEQEMKQWIDKPALFRCIVRRKANIGGSKCLKADEGDVVEVLQEMVGPGKVYALCRMTAQVKGEPPIVGWYPSAYLEKIEKKGVLGFLKRG